MDLLRLRGLSYWVLASAQTFPSTARITAGAEPMVRQGTDALEREGGLLRPPLGKGHAAHRGDRLPFDRAAPSALS